jgi:diguanylate cyclase (GGDEF)-like protein
MLVLYDLARGLTGRVDLADAGDVISKHIRRILPASTCVFFVLDEASDELYAAHAAGDNSAHFSGLRIPRGQRLTGWVAANKQTILNSDPVLDLGEVARSIQPRLRSCLSTPLVDGTHLVGVLTVYSTNKDAFSEDHRRIIEVVARQVTKTVTHAVALEDRRSAAFTDQLTGLPNRQHLTRFIASEIAAGGASSELAIILVDLDALKTLNRRHGRAAGDRALATVADAIRSVLRGADILFRYDSDEFVVLLTQTQTATAREVADRMTAAITAIESRSSGAEGPVSATLTVASAPADGTTLDELVLAARGRDRLKPDNDTPTTSIH